MRLIYSELSAHKQKKMDDWLNGRPKTIHKLAEKIPPGSRLVFEDQSIAQVVSYFEDGGIGISWEGDYDSAVSNRRYICEKCLETALGNINTNQRATSHE